MTTLNVTPAYEVEETGEGEDGKPEITTIVSRCQNCGEIVVSRSFVGSEFVLGTVSAQAEADADLFVDHLVKRHRLKEEVA